MLKRLLASPRLVLGLVLLAVVLAAPSLGSGFQTEDYILRVGARGAPSLFTNLFGTPENAGWDNYRNKDFGGLPWLTAPDWRVAFWRPVASFLHNIEYRWIPSQSALMHAHSLLWLAALVALVSVLYRRLFAGSERAWIGGLAALLFAVDDGHGFAVGWLANRSALVAATLGAGALLAHDCWRRDGRWLYGVLSPVLLGLGLLAAESALGVAGFLLAHAVFLDTAPRRERFVRALPWVAVVLAWNFAYRVQGYGAYGSGAYVDPFSQPLDFLRLAGPRFIALCFGLFGAAPIDLLALLDPGWLPWLMAGACVFLGLVLWLLVPLVRVDATARFWAAGALLALVPACTALPAERMLFIPGIGASALVALLVAHAFTATGTWRGFAQRAARGLGALWLLVHGVASAALLPVRSLGLAHYSAWVDDIGEQAFGGSRASQDLVVVNAHDFYTGVMMLATRAARGQPIAAHTRILHGGPKAVVLRRPDAFTLIVEPEGGFMNAPTNVVYRSSNRPMHVGEGLQLTGVQVVVTAVDAAGMPLEAAFRFAEPLESSSLRFVAWDGRRYEPFEVPAIGGQKRVTPQAVDPFGIWL